MDIETNETPRSPWHPGEKAMQRSVGVADHMEQWGRRVIRDHLIDQHREFYPLLPFAVLGAVDPDGNPWASLRAGHPGFVHAADTRTLRVTMPRDASDPADRGMNDGDGVSLLGIDPRTRRRNRVNGIVRREADSGFDIGVVQAYGVCPRYIQLRAPEFTREPAVLSPEPVRWMTELDARARAIIAGADTLFVASYLDPDPAAGPQARQVDVSHRGGKTGFVRVGADGVLTVPEFPGNLFFNTLGNFMLNPRAGVVFTDFETGDLLQMTGTAEVVLESPEIATFQGAERFWRFRPERIVLRPAALPLRLTFQPDGWSPNSLLTGSWEDSDRRLKAIELANTWRPFRVMKIVEESRVIRSLTLVPVDTFALAPHRPGQHLPIRVQLPGADAPSLRTYTLSSAPSDDAYRLSVKKEGAVSSYLHNLKVGDTLEARAPAGSFTIDATVRKPVVMLAGGVGITPMIAMLRYLVFEGFRLRRTRPMWLFYAARTRAERAFDDELAALVEQAKGALRVIRVLSTVDGLVEKQDYDIAGRLDMQALRNALPFDDYEFFVCGPPGFMQACYDGLRSLNIADERIHAEAFGPAALRRTPSAADALPAGPPPATQAVAVAFLATGKEARWTPDSGSLLELAEARGVDAPFSCRTGTCGTCATRVVKGTVAYTRAPTITVPEGQALICCSVPAASADGSAAPLQLDL